MDYRLIIVDFYQRFKNAFTDEVSHIFTRFTYHWLLWILPLILFGLLSSVFSAGVLVDLPVGYVDQDKSELSRAIIRDLNSGPHAHMINYEDGLNEAGKALAKVNMYGLLYIPPNFEANVSAGHQPIPVLYYNALYYSAGLYSVQDYSGLIADLNSQYRSKMANLFGVPIPKLANGRLNYDGLFNPSSNYLYYQQFSAMVHLLQLFVITITIHILGNLPRRTKPCYLFVMGKLAPYTLWYTVLLIFEIALLVFFSEARVSGSAFAMLIVGFFYVMAAQSIGILLFSYTRTIIDAYSYIGLFVGLALTYSGVVLPELSMPESARIISSLEPLTYALNTLFDLFLRETTILSVIETCLILMIYPIIATLLVWTRLAKRLKKEGKP